MMCAVLCDCGDMLCLVCLLVMICVVVCLLKVGEEVEFWAKRKGIWDPSWANAKVNKFHNTFLFP